MILYYEMMICQITVLDIASSQRALPHTDRPVHDAPGRRQLCYNDHLIDAADALHKASDPGPDNEGAGIREWHV